MYKRLRKALALLLSLILFCSSVTVYATETTTNADAIEEVTILYEIENLRDQYSKTFLLSNGNRMAISSIEPIHYQTDDCYWQDIDNSL